MAKQEIYNEEVTSASGGISLDTDPSEQPKDNLDEILEFVNRKEVFVGGNPIGQPILYSDKNRWLCGIYKIHCISNNKVYVGSSNSIAKRINGHINSLRYNIHTNQQLQNTWNKYGGDNFRCEVVVICPEEYRFKLEQWFLDNTPNKMNVYDNVVPNKGMALSSETKSKISSRLKNLSSEMSKIRSKNIRKIGSLYGATNGKIVSRKVTIVVNGEKVAFNSISECSRITGLARNTIYNRIKNGL